MFWKGVISLGFQCMCYALRSPVIKTRNPSLRHSERPDYERSAVERWNSTSFSGPFANTEYSSGLQTRNGYSVRICASENEGRRAACVLQTVCTVRNTVFDPKDLIRLEV